MDKVLAVVLAGGLDTLRLLLFLLGPVFLAAFLMYLVSSFIGKTAGKSIGIKAFAWLTAPGIIIHELGHAIFCVVFRHRIVEMKVFDPQPDGTLGSVSHTWEKGSFYQNVGNFFIGTGPIWFGGLVVYLLSLALMGSDFLWAAVNTPVSAADIATPGAVGALSLSFLKHVMASVGGVFDPSLLGVWKYWVFVYLTLCIGLHMSLSPADMKGALAGFLLVVGLSLVLNLGVAAFLALFPSSAAAGTLMSITAVMVRFSLAVAGVLFFTILPALTLMLLIDLFALAARFI